MKLFHGTTHTASVNMENNKLISHLIERPHYKGNGFETTDGYVYLTDNIGYAAYLAQRHSVLNDEDLCVIYEVDIATSELGADFDQLKIIGRMNEDDASKHNTMSSLASVQSCRVARSLKIGSDVTRKLTLPSGSNTDHEDYPLMVKLRELRKAGNAQAAEALIPKHMWEIL